MRHAFKGSIPEETVGRLRPGDWIFVQTLGCWVSWAIMYLTRSEFSHVAMYDGNGRVTHATTSGVGTQPLTSMISQETLIVPCRLPQGDECPTRPSDAMARHLGKPFDWPLVVLKGLRIVLGREPVYFRASFFLDAAIVLAVLDIPLWLLVGRPVLLWVLPAYALVALVNLVVGRACPLPLDRTTAKPVELFLLACTAGATFLLAPSASWEFSDGADDVSAA